MTRKEVLIKLCEITTSVMERQYRGLYTADCFCNEDIDNPNFQFEPEILDFIQQAIAEKIIRDKTLQTKEEDLSH